MGRRRRASSLLRLLGIDNRLISKALRPIRAEGVGASGQDAVTTMHVDVEFRWRDAGRVTLEQGLLRFPAVGYVPGIYQFDFGEGSLYIGEADRLQRRLQNYRTPGGDPETLKPRTNRRVHRAIVARLNVGTVGVSVCTQASISIDGDRLQLNLAGKTERLMVESAATIAAQRAGYRLENLAVKTP